MRLARKIALLATAALAAMALAATNASAQGISISDEATGSPCNPCMVHATGSSTLFAHVFFGEVQISACNDEFEAEVYDPDGMTDIEFGHVYNYNNDHPVNANCTRENCAGVDAGEQTTGEREWPMRNAVETAANTGTMLVDFCLRDENGAEEMCEIPVTVTETGAHQYQFTASTANECRTRPSNNHVEVDGTWTMENPASTPHDVIEIAHL